MLTQLSIKNYTIIQDVTVNFDNGLTVITGETGAGKSIFLGALSLLLGKRADLSQIRGKENKCVIEGHFSIASYGLSTFFSEHDLDFDVHTILRREITPSGKSRAFINDTPVTLQIIQELGSYLVDIHSQFDTQFLTSENYQMQLLDVLANNDQLLVKYSQALSEYKSYTSKLTAFLTQQAEAQKEADYNQFLFDELETTKLGDLNQETLEATLEELSNVEAIQNSLSETIQLLNAEDLGSYDVLLRARNTLSKIRGFGPRFESLWNRLNSLSLEMDDVLNELETTSNTMEASPEVLYETQQVLENLYKLQKKHNVTTVEALEAIRNNLQEKLDFQHNAESQIQHLETEIAALEKILTSLSNDLHTSRKSIIPKLKHELETVVKDLGIEQAIFEFELEKTGFKTNGSDNLSVLFSANKGLALTPLGKAASGGELSRIMLAIKSILGAYKKLPTIIFDEIDTGVSGEIAHRMALIIEQMSENIQLISITHLPQIAAKGNAHKKVFKTNTESHTFTHIKTLTADDRITELAQMIGGGNVGESAIAHAKELLN